jgi:uncharacterized tellurite resistance protein B-like protein
MFKDFFLSLLGFHPSHERHKEVSLLFDQWGERLSTSSQKAVITLCAAVAIADGFLGREEFRRIIESMNQELAISNQSAGLLLDAVLSNPEGISIESAAEKLRESLDVSQLHAIEEILRQIALAEDGIHSEEQRVIAEVHRLLFGEKS